MKKSKILPMVLPIAMATAPLAIVSCSNTENVKPETPSELKAAAFNISFATDNDSTENYKRWQDFLKTTPAKQNELIEKFKSSLTTGNKTTITPDEKAYAERMIQIRNVAAIIQDTRPDVILLNEFNNDGTNGNIELLQAFQDNFLSIPQSLNSIDGGDLLEPIHYPFKESYATNTGLKSDMDLNNDGNIDNNPQDAFGFGYYHGHYAFGIMSKYEIDKKNTRTFQKFLWKDLPGAEIPKILKAHANNPAGMNVGDNWFTDEEWSKLRLSSKNHVDIPLKVGDETIHILASHPTPPVFEIGGTRVNWERNKAEIQFWDHYINNEATLYDDNGIKGGIDGEKEKFIIMGDLNADNFDRSTETGGITKLVENTKINTKVVAGDLLPVSIGGFQEDNRKKHPKPGSRTSVFGLRVDWALPSNNLNTIETGVYWRGTNEKGRLLFNDPRIGTTGKSKEVSSDHRLVWSTIKLK